MIGTRFKIYVDEVDAAQVHDRILEMGGLVVGALSPTPGLRVLTREEVAREGLVLAVPPSLTETLTPHTTPGGRWYALDSGQDPVVEFIPSHRKGRALLAGRFYFVRESVVDGEFRAKSRDVLEFADSVFAWARKWSRRAGGRSCGPSAADSVRAGAVDLEP